MGGYGKDLAALTATMRSLHGKHVLPCDIPGIGDEGDIVYIDLSSEPSLVVARVLSLNALPGLLAVLSGVRANRPPTSPGRHLHVVE